MAHDPRWSDERHFQDRSGERWNFRYWYSGWSRDHTKKAQRLFFWNDSKNICGVIVLLPGRTQPYSRLLSLMKELTAKAELRERYRRQLRFPLERYYSEFGSLEEETSLTS